MVHAMHWHGAHNFLRVARENRWRLSSLIIANSERGFLFIVVIIVCVNQIASIAKHTRFKSCSKDLKSTTTHQQTVSASVKQRAKKTFSSKTVLFGTKVYDAQGWPVIALIGA